MGRRTVNPPTVFDTLGYGFSQAVTTTGEKTIHVSGQVGWDRNEALAGDDLETQIEAAFVNLAHVLSAAGAELVDVAALRIYVVESAADDLSPVRRALGRTFPAEPPAATWLVVRGLASPGLLVEVEATAVVD